MRAKSRGQWSLKSEQCLCMAFSEDVTSSSLTMLAVPSAGDGRKEEEKPAGVGWEAELHHAHAGPTRRSSRLIGLAEISFHLCLIKRSTAV